VNTTAIKQGGRGKRGRGGKDVSGAEYRIKRRRRKPIQRHLWGRAEKALARRDQEMTFTKRHHRTLRGYHRGARTGNPGQHQSVTRQDSEELGVMKNPRRRGKNKRCRMKRASSTSPLMQAFLTIMCKRKGKHRRCRFGFRNQASPSRGFRRRKR